MAQLLKIKEQIMQFVSRHEMYVYAAIRFLIALATFSMIGANIGFMDILTSPVVLVVLAAACAFLPAGFMLFISCVLIFFHFMQLSPELALLTLLLFAVMFFLYFRFSNRKGMYAMLTGLLSFIGIPYVMPVAVGLRERPQHVISVICGSVAYCICENVKVNAALFTQSEDVDHISMLTQAGQQIFGSSEIYLIQAAYAAAAILVYALSRRGMNHAREVSLVLGIVIQLIIIGGGELYLQNAAALPGLLVGCVISMPIAYVVSVFTLSLDYSRTENVQFEDDEYFYYVRAVPKVSVTVADKQMTRISSADGEEPDESEVQWPDENGQLPGDMSEQNPEDSEARDHASEQE
jgi:hypothetical protein